MPILSAEISNCEVIGLAMEAEPEKARFTGTSNEVEAKEHVHYLLPARPKLRHMGILYRIAKPVAAGGAFFQPGVSQVL